jgi:hypothetical protein
MMAFASQSLVTIFDSVRPISSPDRIGTDALILEIFPVFNQTAILLMDVAQIIREHESALSLVRMSLTRSDLLPPQLVANPNILALQENITVAMASFRAPPEPTVPEFDFSRILGNLALALTKLGPVFDIQPLRVFRERIGHAPIHYSGSRDVKGLVIGRMTPPKERAQVTIFTPVLVNVPIEFFDQMPIEGASDQLDSFLSAIPKEMLDTGAAIRNLANIAGNLPNAEDRETLALRYGGISDDEIIHYATALSQGHLVSWVGEAGEIPMDLKIHWENTLPQYQWLPMGQWFGTIVVSSDPYDAILSSGELENIPTGDSPFRNQIIPMAVRDRDIIVEQPWDVTVGLYRQSNFIIQMPVPGGTQPVTIDVGFGLRGLLRFESQNLRYTVEPTLVEKIYSYLFALVEIAKLIPATDDIGHAARFQAALGITQPLFALASTDAGRQFSRAVAYATVLTQSNDVAMRTVFRTSLRNRLVAFHFMSRFMLTIFETLDLIDHEMTLQVEALFEETRIAVQTANNQTFDLRF